MFLLVYPLKGFTLILLQVYAFALFTPLHNLVYASGSASADGQSLYVPGESGSTYPFIIDLSVSWNTSNPAIKTLPALPSAPAGLNSSDSTSILASALLSNGQRWLVLTAFSDYLYDVGSRTWSQFSPTLMLSSDKGLAAVTDPATDTVYILNGAQSEVMLTVKMAANDSAGIIDSTSMMDDLKISANSSYSIVWSSSQQSMIMYGGADSNMYAYNATNGWITLTTGGTIPTPRNDACLVSAYGGSELVLFGGYNATANITLNDIYIFDVAKLQWTRGPDVDPMNARAGAACAAPNDYFVAWGGYSSLTAFNTTMVYNIRSAVWTSTYINMPVQTATTSTFTTTLVPTSTSNTPTTLASPSPSAPSTSATPSIFATPSIVTTPSIVATVYYPNDTLSTDTPTPPNKGYPIITIAGAVFGVAAGTFTIGVLAIYRSRVRAKHAEFAIDFDPSSKSSSHPVSSTDDLFPFNLSRSRSDLPKYAPPSPAPPLRSMTNTHNGVQQTPEYQNHSKGGPVVQDGILQECYYTQPSYLYPQVNTSDSFEPYRLPKFQYGA
ncbi:hypothetical protein EDD21DRAFT_427215 [Dissophora ornata]|nr:hypothetical protein BGZ58_009506 [Dissophora ornata]KAI8605995.1 hypothetical protein EDD21DRAFT_427215 [Dissophora ornata]